MYAIIKTGGKQYKVSNGDTLQVEKIEGKAGDKVSLGEVLAVNDGKATKIGAPLVSGASVSAEIVEQGRADKVIIFKKKRRHNYRRKLGHRQHLTTLKITDVTGKGAKAAPAKKAEEKPAAEKKAAAPKKETAAKKAPAKKPAAKATEAKKADAKPAAKKPAAKKAAPKKEAATEKKTTAAKKPAAKKAPAKKPAAKKPAAKKADKE